ncbi:switch 2 [Dendrobium catenatum]|uniref:DNA repair and recombination protein RAD54 n=1 Tax=Dendrobium catenatum TaxID=906689 RepID=A0A2I0W362_9ASPA|nr:switch 2 [Dendrobium catenatum]PKU70093.1 DNA repair and recombination protein RAD54 [Dendrobium catenatum]
MSMNRLKDTLRSCSHSTSTSTSTSTFGDFITGDSEIATTSGLLPAISLFSSTDNLTLRKPPKSSLSQQLQRLDFAFFPPEENPSFKPPRRKFEGGVRRGDRGGGGEEEVEERDGEETVIIGRDAAVSKRLDLGDKGPFEPLILSSPGESPVVQVPASINCRLLEHQREGVKFLYGLYKNNHGGVLGDDMGLGKTIQTIAFLSAVLRKDLENSDCHVDGKKGSVLILCPTSVLRNWENEFSEWGTFSVAIYHGPNRDLILEKLAVHTVEIVITSFDTFRNHDQILTRILWDIVVVDEAHRLKNEKSQFYKSCLGIRTTRRYGLTGTIMQNKILELFNLFDWFSPGSLGTREHFREFYDEPLKHGQRLSAPERFIQIANKRKQHLVTVLHKYLLRRTKEETIGHLMLGKQDNVVFCAMSDLQKRVYKRMLELPEIQCLVNKDLPCSCGSPLTQVECCKRIVPNGIIWSYLHRDNPDGCESCPFCLVLPCLIKLQQISNHLELIKPNTKDEVEKQKKDAELASAVFGTDIDLVGGNAQNESFMGLSDAEHCGKMRALEKLMFHWLRHGDKILLFSYSVRMLDILEKFLIRKGYCFSRLDGSTPMSLRQSLVDNFNMSPSKQVFLISTRAGGLGLNLVSANRVVIFDPNWNPAQDLQAQDRSFRYGQKRHVVVFRLLAAGSLEELVYSRQIYKQQLSNIAVSGKVEKRYFEGVQDCKEFKGELFGICNLFRDLSDKLFTSEIIEMHTKHGKQYDPSGGSEDVLKNEGKLVTKTSLLNLDVDDASLSNKGNHDSCSDKYPEGFTTAENKQSLNDLGILYAHRNEDIVNMGPRYKVQPASITEEEKNNSKVLCKPDSVVKSHTREQKRNEFKKIAQYRGMELLEFSNWILSASPTELKQLLKDYQKKKRKRQLVN